MAMTGAELKEKAFQIRKDIINMLGYARSGHPGGSLDLAEIMSVLYFDVMNFDFDNPQKEDRDYFVMSKGHAAPALYSVFHIGGIISDEEIESFRQKGSRLQGHPDRKRLPGIEASTGSLGQGFSIANGIALGLKLDNKANRVYSILGDGELQEGIIWEAAMSAAHYKLDNLCAVLDNNGLQIDGSNDEVMSLGDIAAKWSGFGWNVIKADGHDFDSLKQAFTAAEECKGEPSIIIAKTTKGKGVSFMENNPGWHGKPMDDQQLADAKAELGME